MKHNPRRTFLNIAGALAVAPFANAQQPGYPVRQIRIVVGFAPGGTADVFARLLAANAAIKLGQPVMVDNKPGAGAIIAADHVAKSAADGYTLWLTFAEPLVSNPALYRRLPYSPARDFSYVAMLAAGPLVVAVNKSVPAKNLQELIAYARRGQAGAGLNFGSWGAGSHGHLLCEAFNKTYQLGMFHVPYKGEGPTIQDLIGGQIQIAAGSIGGTGPHIRRGALNAIGVIGSRRSRALPDVKTLYEQGATDVAFTTRGWVGLVGPAGLPSAIIDRWVNIVREFLATPEVQQRFAGYGFEPAFLPPDGFIQKWQGDAPVWARLIKQSGVTLD